MNNKIRSEGSLERVQARTMKIGNRLPLMRDVADISRDLSELVNRLKGVREEIPGVDFSPNVKRMLKLVASSKIVERININLAV